MTLKDYRAIAAVFKPWLVHGSEELGTADRVLEDLADYMVADNPRFDRYRFIKACYQS